MGQFTLPPKKKLEKLKIKEKKTPNLYKTSFGGDSGSSWRPGLNFSSGLGFWPTAGSN